MSPLGWIVVVGLAMSAVSLVGGMALPVSEDRLDRLLISLVGLAAASLLGGVFFLLLPAGLAATDDPVVPFVWLMVGFTIFFLIGQLHDRHPCRRAGPLCREP